MGEPNAPDPGTIPLKHARVMRGPIQIAFDITNKCNYRCLHCYNRSGENPQMEDELTDDEVIFLIKDIAELKPRNICFCGGEPLLRKNIILECAKILRSNNIIISVVSNGSLMTKATAEELISSGVTRIQISLDGSRPESVYNLRLNKKAFDYAVNALKNVKEAGCNDISVSFIPTIFNRNEFEETYKICREIGVRDFRFQPLMILGRAQKKTEKIMANPIHYRELVRKMHDIKNSDINSKTQLEWGDPIDHLMRFSTLLEHCVILSNIHANGDLAASPYLPIVVGNVKKHKFSEYWNSGLPRIWEIPDIKNLANRIKSIKDFGNIDDYIPRKWYDKDIVIDLIDDNIIDIDNKMLVKT